VPGLIQDRGERAQTPSDIFLGGENGAVLREQDSAGPAAYVSLHTIEYATATSKAVDFPQLHDIILAWSEMR